MPSDLYLVLMVMTHAALTVWAYGKGVEHGVERVHREVIEAMTDAE